jgi:MOSC domain-containing protein YiiM
MSGVVISINISEKKDEPKRPIAEGVFEVRVGVLGDAHAGAPMEVSILSIERAEELADETGEEFLPGCFAENVTIRDFPTENLKIGDRIGIGEVILEIVQLGKPKDIAHTYSYRGYSLLPKYWVFANVVMGGIASPGDEVKNL